MFKSYLTLFLGCVAFSSAVQAQSRSLVLEFNDTATGNPIAARMEFLQNKKSPLKPKNGLIVEKQVLVEGETEWTPSVGNYEFWLRRGPEFAETRGNFTIEGGAKDSKVLQIERRTDMHAEGWYSGDLLSTIEPSKLRRWQAADELDMVVSTFAGSDPKESKPVSGKSNSKVWVEEKSLKGLRAGSFWDDRPESGLVIHGWKPDKPPAKSVASTSLIEQAKKEAEDSHVEIQSLVSPEVPIWLATQKIDLVQIISTHLAQDGESKMPKGIWNEDPDRYDGRHGLGRYIEDIYWQMLEAGLYVPPSAGSGFGKKGLDTCLGYNRVYVALSKIDSERTEEAWWKSLLGGHSMITNGPLLRARINGVEPGETFRGTQGQKISLAFDVQLSVRDPVDYLDVIFNGRTLYNARLEEHAARGTFPQLSISESGWLVVRVVTGKESTYRFATTAPFYFEFDGQRRVSRKGVRFFQSWLEDSAKKLKKGPQAKEQESYLEMARSFWSDQESKATAD